ncbi:Fur family transcriptional regulator [Zavarzinia compransoris]|uniref:Ferric uptake regulation protein n=1 Tax=Zavarzinia compransoris TaxID=1264899 RepID=A0A317E8P3_9PROT|nr:transcriptional repressor [Zavarzinia compransoris]PWR21663.1 transcriptional repressor [Zavarzinia compransoris]TDP45555.1 Fur family ferric uptake transcriptional regulator [Zavarzinia compransoris]
MRVRIGRRAAAVSKTLSPIETLCAERGLHLGKKRRILIRLLEEMDDHPCADEVYARAIAVDSRIGIATVYRTLALFEEEGILVRRDFGDKRARYEVARKPPHHHMIDVENGRIIEFEDDQIHALLERIAARGGYRLIGTRLELFVAPADSRAAPGTSPSDAPKPFD